MKKRESYIVYLNYYYIKYAEKKCNIFKINFAYMMQIIVVHFVEIISIDRFQR